MTTLWGECLILGSTWVNLGPVYMEVGDPRQVSIKSVILLWSRLHVSWGNLPHVTSPTWGPPPSCKQTLISFAAVFRLVTITATKETKVNRVCSTVTLPMEFVNFTGRQILQLRTQRSSESTLRFFLKNGNCVLLNLFWLIQESPNYQRAAIYALEICSLAGRVPTEL